MSDKPNGGHAVHIAEPKPQDCPLTDYQLRVLGWVANGKTNFQIAGIMGNTTEGNIEQHLHRIFNAIGAPSRTAAVVIGLRRGWLT